MDTTIEIAPEAPMETLGQEDTTVRRIRSKATARQRKIVDVSPELLIGILPGSEYWTRILPGQIPADAKAVGVYYDTLEGCWSIVLESSEFPEVPEYERTPRISLIVESRLASKFDMEDGLREVERINALVGGKA